MKKTILASAVAVAGLAVSGATFAAAAPAPMMTGVTTPWHVGVGVNYTANTTDKLTASNSDTMKLNDRGVGGNLFVGYRVNHYFGTELGFNWLGTDKYEAKDASTGTKTKDALKLQDQWNVNFVGQAFLPVNSWFSPYAFGGAAYMNSEVKASSGTKDEVDGVGLIYGAGLQFNFNQFGVRASYTRQDLLSGSDHNSISVNGVNYEYPQTKDYISLDVLYRFGA